MTTYGFRRIIPEKNTDEQDTMEQDGLLARHAKIGLVYHMTNTREVMPSIDIYHAVKSYCEQYPEDTYEWLITYAIVSWAIVRLVEVGLLKVEELI
jgi:hypothetical protein